MSVATEEEPYYALARPPQGILVADVVALGRRLSDTGQSHDPQGWAVVEQLGEVQQEAVTDVALSNLIELRNSHESKTN